MFLLLMLVRKTPLSKSPLLPCTGRSQELALTERAPVLIAFSVASLSEDVQIVRRRFGQKLDAGDAMAFLAQPKDTVKLPMKTLFRIASRTNFPLALDAYSQ